MVTEQDKDTLLDIIYELGGHDISQNILLSQAHTHLGEWNSDMFWAVAQSLTDDKLIEIRTRNGFCAFTMKGRDRVNARRNPKPTFTQNTIHAKTITNSPIQQTGAHSVALQTTIIDSQSVDDLHNLVDVFEKHINDLNLDSVAKKKAMNQVSTLKAQLDLDPNPIIIKEAGRSLRNITEGVIASLISASAIDPGIWSKILENMAKLFGS